MNVTRLSLLPQKGFRRARRLTLVANNALANGDLGRAQAALLDLLGTLVEVAKSPLRQHDRAVRDPDTGQLTRPLTSGR
jgi:hypothetical protein